MIVVGRVEARARVEEEEASVVAEAAFALAAARAARRLKKPGGGGGVRALESDGRSGLRGAGLGLAWLGWAGPVRLRENFF